MTHEQRIESLQGAVQTFLNEIPGATAVFTYPDAEAALEAVERQSEPAN